MDVEKFSTHYLAEINQLRFAKVARLMLGEADADAIKGVSDPQENGDFSVTEAKGRRLLSFHDKKERAGPLILALPKTISIFEIDPRYGMDEGHGPVLDKGMETDSKCCRRWLVSQRNRRQPKNQPCAA